MASKKELTNGKYIDDQMGNGIPEGGKVSQILKKLSDADYDVHWEDFSAIPKNNPISLSFNWGKRQTVTALVSPNYATTFIYYKLGIDFTGLDFTSGIEYTLLIDRFRNQEKKGRTDQTKSRKSKYYHELQEHALANHRVNEIKITSATGQYFDFNQGNYFKREINVLGQPTNVFSGGTGNSINRRKTRGTNNTLPIYFVNLSFRIRFNNNGVITETSSLGTIALSVNQNKGANPIISYARPSK